MTSMTETSAFSPILPLTMPAVMLPDDVKTATERLMNLWVGAMSPLWAPFWAASSFGVGAWALTRGFRPAESLLAEMPADGWLGLFRSWGLEAGELHEKAVEAVETSPKPLETVAGMTEAKGTSLAETAMDTAADSMNEAADATVQTAEKATDLVSQAAIVPEKAAAETEKAAAQSVAPKPIAQGVSAARKPKGKV